MSAAALVLCAALLGAPPVRSVEELPKLLGEEFDLLEAVDALDRDIAAQQTALEANAPKLRDVTSRRDRALRRHEEAKRRLVRDRKLIRQRIRAYLDLQRIREWQTLVSSRDYATYLRKRRLVRELIKGDEARIRAYHVTVAGFRAAAAALEAERKGLAAVEARISKAREQLERDRSIKTALLESVRTEKSFIKKAGKDLDKASRALQDKIDGFQDWRKRRKWFRASKGRLRWPVPGAKVASRYSRVAHPKYGTVTQHRGLTFTPGKKGAHTVYPAFPGKVVFAGWLRGYGNTIIVEHTGKDFTLYAHLDEMFVSEGDMVSRKRIGTLGKSGSLQGEQLYFELRLDGRPVDPSPWFR